jgi:hypothetical protein
MIDHEAPFLHRDEQHDELCMLYSISTYEIANLKRRQLNVTNYAIALYVVLVLIAKLVIVQPASNWKLSVLCFVAVAAAIAGMLAVSRLQKLIGIRRNRLRAVRQQFSKAFHASWGEDETGDDILLSHRAIIIVGVLFAVYLIGFEATQIALEP